MPEAIQGDLARWVEDNVDALVKAFTFEDDAVVVAAHEGDVVDDGDGGVCCFRAVSLFCVEVT